MQEASLVVEAEISPTAFAEVGRPTGAYPRADGGAIALASEFDSLYWPGRVIYDGHRLRYRLCLYAADLATLVGIFDGARFPINDAAFHPSHPFLAIATGTYDGGWCYEGELLVWNWETGEVTKILSESREISRVRYEGGGAMALLVRPRDDGEPYNEGAVLGGILRDLRPFSALGLSDGEADPRLADFAQVETGSIQFDRGAHTEEDRTASWAAALSASSFEQRHRVWDVAWGASDEVLAVHDRCHIESWTASGRLIHRIQGKGHGVQILKRREDIFVHVLERANWLDKSTLIRVREGNAEPVATFAPSRP